MLLAIDTSSLVLSCALAVTRCPIPRRKKWNVSSVIPRRKRNGTTATSYGGH